MAADARLLQAFVLALCSGLLRQVAGSPEPLLDVMYLKYKQQPIDTTPVFDRMVVQYQATLDWKMKFFSVQATPLGEAIVENIHLCPVQADCLKQDQTVVTMDFSRNILVEPGSTVLYKFDVLLQGQVRSYSIMVHRLKGNETNIRHMIVEGSTLTPSFKSNIHDYRTYLSVGTESALLELHIQDQGQTILASADAPVPLTLNDNITRLGNTHPGKLRSPPLRLRRLREEAYGEFQYPNKYIEFPVPMGTKRTVSLKVISSDGGHFGYYSLEMARETCSAGLPLFDVVSGQCVRFCNTGYWADYKAGRCKRCHNACVSCLSQHRCVRCPLPDAGRQYVLDNVTGTCIAREKALWERNPERAAATILAAGGFSIFLCGLCAFRFVTPQAQKRPPRKDAPTKGGSAAAKYSSTKGGGAVRNPAAAGYTKVASEDFDAF